MQIQRAPQGGPTRRPQSNPPQEPTPPGHHHHGLSGTLLHVGHDAAMLAMAAPSGHHAGMHSGGMTMPMDDNSICHGTPMPAGHQHHEMSTPTMHQHGSATSHATWLSTGSALLCGAVALGSAVHGAQMLASKDGFTRLDGANHLLMSASCGVMAGAMLAPQTGLGAYTAPLMGAHGLAELALGSYQLVRGTRQDCQHDQVAGVLKIAHGGCLAAAQLFPGAALPLYLGMTAVTATQISLQQAGLSH